MKTLSIDEAMSRHGGNTLRDVIENMSRSGEYHDIWLYANVSGGGYSAPYTHFLCATKSDDTRQVVAFLMRRDVSHDTRVYEKGSLKKLLDPELDLAIIRKTPAQAPAQSENTEKDQSDIRQIRSIRPAWYFAKSDSKHTRQVVVTLPPEAAVPPKVANLIADFAFMQSNWAATALFMAGEDSGGPSIFAKATGVIDRLKGVSASLALAFYRLNRGGIFQIFIQVDTPAIRSSANGAPYLAEHSRWLDDKEDIRLIEALIARDELEVCFVAPGDNGPCTGYFGLRVELPKDVKDALKKEWNELLAYHTGISGRDYQAALNQYNRENPMEGTPLLPPPAGESRKAESERPNAKKKWWEFWR